MNIDYSTYFSDPKATHCVQGISERFGSGILGYYTNEFAAHLAARYFRNNGATNVSVFLYEPENISFEGDIHPFVLAQILS